MNRVTYHLGILIIGLVGFSACYQPSYKKKSSYLIEDIEQAPRAKKLKKIEQTTSEENLNVPKWYAKPPVDPNYIYGTSSQLSRDLQVAINKSVAAARADIGRQVKVKVQALQKRYVEDVSNDENNKLLNFFTEAEKTVVSLSLAGSRVREQSFAKEGKNWRAFVLVEYPLEDIQLSLAQLAKKNNARSYLKKHYAETRRRASKAFQELAEAVGEKPVKELETETLETELSDIQEESVEEPKAKETELPSEESIFVPPPSNNTFDNETVSVETPSSQKFKTERNPNSDSFKLPSFMKKKKKRQYRNSIYINYIGSYFGTKSSDTRYSMQGASLGYEYYIVPKKVTISFDAQVCGNTNSYQTSTNLVATIGTRINLIHAKSWEFGFIGKFGISLDFGKNETYYYYYDYASNSVNNNLSNSARRSNIKKRNDGNNAEYGYYNRNNYWNYNSYQDDYVNAGAVAQLGIGNKILLSPAFFLAADGGYVFRYTGNNNEKHHGFFFSCGLGFNF